jgi:4-aminobutyrate aminotransferase-like enzyme
MVTRTVPLRQSNILRAYAEKTPCSRALAARARALLPNGVTHVGRYLEPHSVYVERAAGPRKWDVDGNEYVDYLGGHGALLLGLTAGGLPFSAILEHKVRAMTPIPERSA